MSLCRLCWDTGSRVNALEILSLIIGCHKMEKGCCLKEMYTVFWVGKCSILRMTLSNKEWVNTMYTFKSGDDVVKNDFISKERKYLQQYITWMYAVNTKKWRNLAFFFSRVVRSCERRNMYRGEERYHHLILANKPLW